MFDGLFSGGNKIKTKKKPVNNGMFSGIFKERPVKQESQPVKTLPSGGQYLPLINGKMATTTRGYGTLETKKDSERDHIIPVSLGGTSNDANLQYLKNGKTLLEKILKKPASFKNRQEGKALVEMRAIDDFQSGKINLNEARQRVLNWKNQPEEFYKTYATELLRSPITATKKAGNFFRNIFKTTAEKIKERKYWEAATEAGDAITQNITKPILNTVRDFGDAMIDAGELIDRKIRQPVVKSLQESEERQAQQYLKSGAAKNIEDARIMAKLENAAMGAVEPLKDVASLKAVGKKVAGKVADELAPLFQEAKKYKSAEEFVNKSSNIYLHGTSVDGDLKLSDGITYLTKDSKAANGFANDVMYGSQRGGIGRTEVLQQVGSGKSKTISIPENIGTGISDYVKSQAEIAKKEGYRFLEFTHPSMEKGSKPFQVKASLFPKDDLRLISDGKMPSLEAAISADKGGQPLPDKLTDIWNEATKKGTEEMPYSVYANHYLKKPSQKSNRPTQLLPQKQNLPAQAYSASSKTTEQELQAIQKLSVKPLENSIAKLADDLGTSLEKEISYKNIVNKSSASIKEKVGILDYLRTPDRVLKKIGLEREATILRTQYEKFVKELPVEIDKITKWAEQTNQDENVNIFRFLDGQTANLSQKEQKIAGEIKSYLAEWADKLKLPKENRISNYITHIFDDELIQKEFPDDLAKIIADKIPGSVYDPFVQKRLGAMGYIEDTWRALDAYVKRGVRKYNLDPALEQIKKASNDMEISQFNYVKSFIDKVNMRPSEIDTLLDNTVKQLVGYKFGQRPVANLTKKARQMVYRGALGLNVSSALRNLSQGANTYAKLGGKYTFKGYTDLLKNWRTDELEQVGILADNFIQDRQLSAIKTVMEKVDKGLFYMFETAEKINRGAAYYGAKAKALAQGKTFDEAIEAAKKLVRDTQFTFGSIDTPVALQNDLVKVISQFQSFTLKQSEFLIEMAKNKEFAGLARYIGSSLLFVFSIGKAFGMKTKDIIPSFRFGAPPAIKPAIETAKAIIDTPDKYGQERDLIEKIQDVGATGIPFVPAGVQLKKTAQGLGVFAQGKKTNAKGKTQFKVEKNFSNLLKSAAFGQYATKEAQKYLNKK